MPNAELTSDNDILEPARNRTVSFWRKQGLVACLQPSHTILVRKHRIAGLFRVVPVSFGDLVSCHAEFTPLTHRDSIPLGVDDFSLGMGHHFAHCGQAGFDAVGGEGIEAGG